MRVSVLGLGYVGCVSAACLARSGHQVTGVDVNPEKVDIVARGRAPIVEAGLDELMARVVGSGALRATTDTAAAVRESDLALICVGTPGLQHGQPDTAGIDRVGRQIGAAIGARPQPFTVVLRSTSLPGTTEDVLLPALQAGSGRDGAARVAMNPEFMREGASLHDFDFPPMILVGARDTAVAAQIRDLYAGVQAPFVHTAIRTAEIVKYACNAFHGLKVAFANEMAALCDVLGADALDVMRVFAMDRKLNISEAYLRPGFAFGGSCLPKDVRALDWAATSHHLDVPVISAILPSNDLRIRTAIDQVLAARKRRIGVIGLAFKSGTDDLRESPVVTVVEALIGKGCDVRILDRHVSLARLMGANRRYIESEIPHIATLLASSVDDILAHAEVLIIGNPSADARDALAQVGAEVTVLDLTRGAVSTGERRAALAQDAAVASARS